MPRAPLESEHWQFGKPLVADGSRHVNWPLEDDYHEYCYCGGRFLTLELLLSHFKIMGDLLKGARKGREAARLEKQRLSYGRVNIGTGFPGERLF